MLRPATQTAGKTLSPQVGMLATVRNRRGVVTAVRPGGGGAEKILHLVSVEYTDPDGPSEEQIIWELEPDASLVVPDTPPEISARDPMVPVEFDALVRATRWSALTPFVDPDGDGPIERLPIASPLHGAIQVEDYQLTPLLRALQMPRISLLLADDVGLGKTVEAGLVLSELILRRRVRRVLVLCPASLRGQWRQEMAEKFALHLDEVDRAKTHKLRQRLGPDANPWRVHARAVASYHYLRQPDVLESFRAACEVAPDAARPPWDLLIVDEAHHLAPAPFGEDSDLAAMLGAIVPFFEHRLFLSATPHNGHTRSFTGLLEFLDPVRFTRTSEINPAQRQRIGDVLVRRLKSDINRTSARPRFCTRVLHAVPLSLGEKERSLCASFREFRRAVQKLVASRKRGEQRAGSFAVEILGKRLLSGPCTFADSWRRLRAGMDSDETADLSTIRAAQGSLDDDLDDDAETEGRTRHAAQVVGRWLAPWKEALAAPIAALDAEVAALKLDTAPPEGVAPSPAEDARFTALRAWIDANLRTHDKKWRDDERIVIFTEFKTSLDMLVLRLEAAYGPSQGAVLELYGGMGEVEREAIKNAFNDQANAVRVLIATDAASEGLNLQRTARNLLHWDIPWNPSRLEQRNGRLDRHGQAREVRIHHFTTDDDDDLAFLAYVVGKAHTIRDDLGSLGEIFDRAFEQALVLGTDARSLQPDLDRALDHRRARAEVLRSPSVDEETVGRSALIGLDALRKELDLSPSSLCEMLDVAMGRTAARHALEVSDGGKRARVRTPIDPRWAPIIETSVRLEGGALPMLAFDPGVYVESIGELEVFRPKKDPALVHLAHPLVHHALAQFARRRFPGTSSTATRWTVQRGAVPEGCDAVLRVTIEEFATNDLRETFHHWVRTLQLPVRGGELGDALPHQPAATLPPRTSETPRSNDVDEARELWDEVERDVRAHLRTYAKALGARVDAALEAEGVAERARAQQRFQSRQGELAGLQQAQSHERLKRQLDELEKEAKQGWLFDQSRQLEEIQRRREQIDEELRRRVAHLEALQRQLSHERARVLDRLLPLRYKRRGEVQVLPVTVEVVLPGGAP